ncbi:hypothetical protein INS49_006815 [Diaporthe citri]|uniref:uncharacterized protein n=1 Tax=Diaporthe citri TaxID=83186 RepID=UPI001C7EA6B8|nr:uncharacterized protein INS49_006815 [Diaporthe citri]KAG6365207.1 hypothetical protein INS49_006815 [Diaporthe citri]
MPNCLMRTLEDLWKTIAASKNALLEPIKHTDINTVEQAIFGPHSSLFAPAFYACLLLQAQDIMKNGVFNPRDFVTRLPEINSKDHSSTAGCYLWVYADIKETKVKLILHDPTITDAVYPGQSGDMYDRRYRHERFLKGELDSKSNHYRVGKGAQRRAMVPFLLVNYKDNSVKKALDAIGLARFLDVLELTLVCLFQSWYPILIHDDPAQPLKRELAAGSLREIQYAKILNGIMVKVRGRTGWAPRRTVGLSWLTPVFSQINSDRTIMYWYDYKQKAYIFRTRRPLVASSKEAGSNQLVLTKALKLAVQKDVIKEGNLKNGQELHIQFRIGYDRDAGRYTKVVAPYVRMPAVTRNMEFLKLLSLSIQIQWADRETGVWKAAILQRTKMLEFDKEANELNAVTFGMRLSVLLTRTHYMNAQVPIPAWVRDVSGVGRYDVKEVFYDHLRQQYCVRPAQVQNVLWPPHLDDLSRRFMQERLVHGLSRVNGNPKIAIGTKPKDLPKWRMNCDCCISLNDSAPCKPIEDGSLCETCKKFGLPQCTWTYAHTTKIGATDWLKTTGKLSDLGVSTFVPRYANQRVEVLASAPYDAEAEMSAAQESSEHD